MSEAVLEKVELDLLVTDLLFRGLLPPILALLERIQPFLAQIKLCSIGVYTGIAPHPLGFERNHQEGPASE